ncbi:hypothetical protein GBA63_09180 [Rubrobacter tropicus]|uniref:Uncharacterized protein n=1 Tax=Rubrobacter tropicus TaxID=2653851 RepID=A0A6G8Q8J2_9ACTN|nr:hypothetical protein [Rubrobacter tropicus]QIN82804.1 hypothetical protein GBA63_09180 [Rubrobacter tropicus]
MRETRMRIEGGSLERLFRLLDLARNPYLGEKVRETVLELGDCFPSGAEEDGLGVSLDRFERICSLVGLDRVESVQFVDLCREAGGLDANQSTHLIGVLERQNAELRQGAGG